MSHVVKGIQEIQGAVILEFEIMDASHCAKMSDCGLYPMSVPGNDVILPFGLYYIRDITVNDLQSLDLWALPVR
eukprot:CAMPEP_0115040994 /NCGR_PEP_ID=MMETSP0216-20121206/45243_1 /TAXON_ID=223996 /ORGANISM="Protocruzia adherens, Strain Boccale" /LENGTH=73 /DNA_ID=CAMNT_0002422507 /DNA_START=541 /DNA_END=762 /DNA_ORIENTATION=+